MPLSYLAGTIAGLVVIGIFAGIGILMAAFPREVNRRRMRLLGQTEGADLYIRAVGIVVTLLAGILAALVVGSGK